MSILNAWVGGDRAWVAVDTQTVHNTDGREFEFQKMIPLIHQNAIIAGRGTAAFLPAVFHLALLQILGFDDLVEQMPKILRGAFDEMIAGAARAGITVAPDIDRETIVLVGWSRWHQRMVAAEYVQHDRSAGFSARTVGPFYFSPWIEGTSTPDFANPCDRAAMADLAAQQVRLIAEHAPGAAGGGRYIVADIRRGGMMIEEVCSLGTSVAQLAQPAATMHDSCQRPESRNALI
jgi:hypothetical protein